MLACFSDWLVSKLHGCLLASVLACFRDWLIGCLLVGLLVSVIGWLVARLCACLCAWLIASMLLCFTTPVERSTGSLMGIKCRLVTHK